MRLWISFVVALFVVALTVFCTASVVSAQIPRPQRRPAPQEAVQPPAPAPTPEAPAPEPATPGPQAEPVVAPEVTPAEEASEDTIPVPEEVVTSTQIEEVVDEELGGPISDLAYKLQSMRQRNERLHQKLNWLIYGALGFGLFLFVAVVLVLYRIRLVLAGLWAMARSLVQPATDDEDRPRDGGRGPTVSALAFLILSLAATASAQEIPSIVSISPDTGQQGTMLEGKYQVTVKVTRVTSPVTSILCDCGTFTDITQEGNKIKVNMAVANVDPGEYGFNLVLEDGTIMTSGEDVGFMVMTPEQATLGYYLQEHRQAEIQTLEAQLAAAKKALDERIAQNAEWAGSSHTKLAEDDQMIGRRIESLAQATHESMSGLNLRVSGLTEEVARIKAIGERHGVRIEVLADAADVVLDHVEREDGKQRRLKRSLGLTTRARAPENAARAQSLREILQAHRRVTMPAAPFTIGEVPTSNVIMEPPVPPSPTWEIPPMPFGPPYQHPQ
ncbi:MAG: hypothetical protein Q8P83_02030 [bacterium]|nr:hypothetical protein [bacterium]